MLESLFGGCVSVDLTSSYSSPRSSLSDELTSASSNLRSPLDLLSPPSSLVLTPTSLKHAFPNTSSGDGDEPRLDDDLPS